VGNACRHNGAGTEPVKAIVGNEAIGAEAHGVGQQCLPAVGLGQPDFNVGQTPLERLDHGEFDGLHPRWVVINIGTNNFSSTKNAKANTPAEVAEGVRTICIRIRAKSPESRIVVMGVLPRGPKASDGFRSKIAELNGLLKDLGQVPGIRFLDIGAQYLQPNGDLPRTLMSDFCHPTDEGYQIWANALKPVLQE
jgi:lysophospholipase L1-like esterase